MTRFLAAAAAAVTLLGAPAFAQEGGSVFTNNPNELPQFFQQKAPNPADWAGPFFHSQVGGRFGGQIGENGRPDTMASRETPRDRAVN